MSNQIDPIIVEVGFKQDASVQDVINHLSTVKSKIEEISGDKENPIPSVMSQLGFSNEAQTQMLDYINSTITGLQSIGSNMTEIPSHLTRSFSVLKSEITSIETFINNIGENQKKLFNDADKRLVTSQKLANRLAAIGSQGQSIINYNKSLSGDASKTIGVSLKDFSDSASYLYSMAIEPAIRRIQPKNKHGISLEGMISEIARDQIAPSMIQKMAKANGYTDELTSEMVKEQIRLLLLGNSSFAMQTGASAKIKEWQRRNFVERKALPTRVTERFINDENMFKQLAFDSYGQDAYVKQKAKEYLQKNTSRTLTKSKTDPLHGLYQFLKSEGTMDELYPLLHELGIATIGEKGEYQLYSKLHEKQLQTLALRAIRGYSDALRSDAVYERSPTDFLNAGKVIGRQGSKPSLMLGLINSLPQDIIPEEHEITEDIKKRGKKVNTGVKIGATPGLARYYIPQTDIDFGTMRALERDPYWKKDTSKGLQTREDDEYVAITDSLIARMFKMKGDRTFGYGRSKEDGSIIRTVKDETGREVPINPNLFSTMAFSKFITLDDKGNAVVDTSHPEYQEAADILAGRKNVRWGKGNEEYRILYTKDDGRAVFGKASIAKEIEDLYEKHHLPSPFKMGNDTENGIYFPESTTKTIKSINTMAKMASSAVPVEELLSDEAREKLLNSTGIFANFEMLYDVLDEAERKSGKPYTGRWSKSKGRRMDGLAYGDPTIFNKDFQGRFGAGTNKFEMAATDWRPMLLGGWEAGHKLNERIFGIDENGERAVYAPSGHVDKKADLDEIRSFITGRIFDKEKAKERALTQEEALDIRNRLFVNTVDKNAAYMIDVSGDKSQSKFGKLSEKHFLDSVNDPEGLFTQADYDLAVEQGRVKNGMVTLLPKQVDAYRRLHSSLALGGDRKHSGILVMNNEEDVLSDKEGVPESVLRAVNAPPEVFKRSEELYKKMLKDLNTTEGRERQFAGDKNAEEAMKNDPSWIWDSPEAITHIESTRRSIEAARARHVVLTDGKRNGGVGVGTVGQVAEIFKELVGMNQEDFGDFAALLPERMEAANAVFSRGISAETIDMLGRFPFASGQYLTDVKNFAQMADMDDYLNAFYGLDPAKKKLARNKRELNKLKKQNASPEAIKKAQEKMGKAQREVDSLESSLEKYNQKMNETDESGNLSNKYEYLRFAKGLAMSNRDPRTILSTIMTASQIYTMNTGDFDGDTVQAFINMGDAFRKNAEIEKRNFEEAYKKIGETEDTPDTPADKDLGGMKLQAYANARNATSKMAIASAALRKAQSAPADSPHRYEAIAEAMKAYDLATSDVKTKNAKFVLGSYAEKYLYSQGAHYERFIKQLQDNSDDGTETDKHGIFRFSGATISDPEGIFAIAARKTNKLEGSKLDAGDVFAMFTRRSKAKAEYNASLHPEEVQSGSLFDLDSFEKMENWYRGAYGAEKSIEARAARFQLDRLEDNIIWGKLLSDEDIDKAVQLREDWRSSLDARLQAKQITQDSDEWKAFEDFEKRVAEYQNDNVGSVRNVRREADYFKSLASSEQDKEKAKGYLDYSEMLAGMIDNPDSQEVKARNAYIETIKENNRNWLARVRKLSAEQANPDNLDEILRNTRISRIVAAAEGNGDRSIYNWSNVKHFIGAKEETGNILMPGLQVVNLADVLDENGKLKKVTETTTGRANYYQSRTALNEHMRDMILDIAGETDKTRVYQNPHTHLGQILHSTMELALSPSEIAERIKNGEDSDAFAIKKAREMILGLPDRETATNDVAALKRLGLGFREDKDTGMLQAYNLRPGAFNSEELQRYTSKVNDWLGYTSPSGQVVKGSIQRQLDYIHALEKENNEETYSIEDKKYQNGKVANDKFGGRIYRRVVTDKEGNIISTETSLDRDWKKKTDLQDGEQEHVFETHAKPDYVTRNKDNGGMSLYDWKSSLEGSFESIPQSAFYANLFTELAEKYWTTGNEKYADYKEFGKMENGKFVSTLRKIIGVDSQGAGTNYVLDLNDESGKNLFKETMAKVDKAFLYEEALGKEGMREAWPYLSQVAARAEKVQEEAKSARQLASDANFNPSTAETQFYLATYAQNKERLHQLGSDIYREHNKNNMFDYIPTDRFTQREKELEEMFTQEMQAAVMKNYGDNEAINKELAQIRDKRAELLQINQQDALNAAESDIVNSQQSIRQILTGVKPSNQTNTVVAAINSLRKASRTKDYLTLDERYYDKEKGFLTDSEDEEIKRNAEARKTAYEKAVNAEQDANLFLQTQLIDFTAKYSGKEQKRINAITRTKPLDPTESFANYVQEKQEELQQMIAQYNENIRQYDEEIKQTKDTRIKNNLEMLKNVDKKSVAALESFLANGFEEQTTMGFEEQLGFRSERKKETTSEQQRKYAEMQKEKATKEYNTAAQLYASAESDEDKEYIKNQMEKAEAKMYHADKLLAQSARTKQIEQYKNETSTIRTQAMLENRQLTEAERKQIAVNEAMAAREKYINEQMALNPNFDETAYRKQYSKTAFEESYDKQNAGALFASRYQTITHAQQLLRALSYTPKNVETTTPPPVQQTQGTPPPVQPAPSVQQEVQQPTETQQAQASQPTRSRSFYTLNADNIARRSEVSMLTSQINKDNADLGRINDLILKRDEIAKIDKETEQQRTSAVENASKWLAKYKSEEDYIKENASEEYFKAQKELENFEQRDDIKQKRDAIEHAKRIAGKTDLIGAIEADPIRQAAMAEASKEIRSESLAAVKKQIMQDAGLSANKPMKDADKAAIDLLMSDIENGTNGAVLRKIGKNNLRAKSYASMLPSRTLGAEELSTADFILDTNDYLKKLGYSENDIKRIQDAGDAAVNAKNQERRNEINRKASIAQSEINEERRKIAPSYEDERDALRRQYNTQLLRNGKIIDSEGRYMISQAKLEERERLEKDIDRTKAELSSVGQTETIDQLKERREEIHKRLDAATSRRDQLGGAVNDAQEQYVLNRIRDNTKRNIKKDKSLSKSDKEQLLTNLGNVKTFDDLLARLDAGQRGNELGIRLATAASKIRNSGVQDYLHDYMQPNQVARTRRQAKRQEQQREQQQQPTAAVTQEQPSQQQQTYQPQIKYDRIGQAAAARAQQERFDTLATIQKLRSYNDTEATSYADELQKMLDSQSIENRTKAYDTMMRENEAEQLRISQESMRIAGVQARDNLNRRLRAPVSGARMPIISYLAGGIQPILQNVHDYRLERSQLKLKISQERNRLNQDINYRSLRDRYDFMSKEEQEQSPEGKDLYAQLQQIEQPLNTYQQQLSQSTHWATVTAKAMSTLGASFSSLLRPLDAVIQRFGRQLFYSAINEAKRFVKEFDKSMTTIQMITLKTDTDMSKLGDTIISQAKELKTSVSNLSSIYETLYRQGLSDEEVEERAEIVTKFSRVSGTKVDAANKLITIAMNTGLVSDPQVAADIVTALGDNAATNAAEIEKGIEKAGAAAAADRTSFAQLAAMLTAITSTTQIGGNVAGRTINTIIGRINKIGSNELIYDENGNATSGSAIASMLKRQGINMYDSSGSKLSTYDILYSLSQKWDSMGDAAQQQIATAIAGTRQYSNFAAIMQGMNEGKVDEYMALAGGAEGIVNKKDEIYLDSLEAKLNDIKTTFDEFINGLIDKDFIKNIIDDVMVLIESTAKWIKDLGGLQQVIKWLIAIKGLLAGMNIGMSMGASIGTAAGSVAGPIGMIAGAVLGAAGGYFLGNALTSSTSIRDQLRIEKERKANANEDYKNYVQKIKDEYEKLNISAQITQVEALKKNENRTSEEETKYKQLLSTIVTAYSDRIDFDTMAKELDSASESVDKLSESSSALEKIARSSGTALDEFAEKMLEETKKEQQRIQYEMLYSGLMGLSGMSGSGSIAIANEANNILKQKQASSGSFVQKAYGSSNSWVADVDPDYNTTYDARVYLEDGILKTDNTSGTYDYNVIHAAKDSSWDGLVYKQVNTAFLRTLSQARISDKYVQDYLDNLMLWLKNSNISIEQISNGRSLKLSGLKSTDDLIDFIEIINNEDELGKYLNDNDYDDDLNALTGISYMVEAAIKAYEQHLAGQTGYFTDTDKEYKTALSDAIAKDLKTNWKSQLPEEIQDDKTIDLLATRIVQEAINQNIISVGDAIDENLINSVLNAVFFAGDPLSGVVDVEEFIKKYRHLILGIDDNPKNKYIGTSGYYRANRTGEYFSGKSVQSVYDYAILQAAADYNKSPDTTTKIKGVDELVAKLGGTVNSYSEFVDSGIKLTDDIYDAVKNGTITIKGFDDEYTYISGKALDAFKNGLTTLESDQNYAKTNAANYLLSRISEYDRTDEGLTQFIRDTETDDVLKAAVFAADPMILGKMKQFMDISNPVEGIKWTNSGTWADFFTQQLHSNSSTYGAFTESTQTKGNRAADAFEQLYKNTAYMSAGYKANVQDQAYDEYEDAYNKGFEEWFSQEVKETNYADTAKDRSKAYPEYEKDHPKYSKEDIIDLRDLDKAVIDEIALAYLKEIINNDYAYNELLNKHQGISKEVYDYILRRVNAYETGSTEMLGIDTSKGINEVMGRIQSGNLRSYDDVIAQLYLNNISGSAQYLSAARGIEALGLNITDFDTVEEGSEQYNRMADVLTRVYGSVEAAKSSMKNFDNELRTNAIKLANSFGDSTEEIVTRMKQLNGTMKEQAEAQKQMTSNRIALAHATYYQTQAEAGKLKNKDIAEYLGWSEEDVKYNPIAAKQLIDLQVEVDRENVLNDVTAVINDLMNELNLTVADIGPYINIGGEVDISQLAGLAAEAEGRAKDIINALLTYLANMTGSITLNAVEGADGKTVKITSSNLRAAGGGYKGKSSSGGGKSKLDALIEGQGHYIKRREHFVNMAQKVQQHTERMNDYQGNINAINDEIMAQQGLYDQYVANIAELEKMRDTLKEGSEDWYKAQEQIDSYRESMAGVINTIDELNGKKISVTETKQANEDRPVTNATTMLQLKAQNYMDRNEFENYSVVMEKYIENIKKEIALNEEQIDEWQDLLKLYEEGSQNWMTTAEKIQALRQENAEKQNKVLEETNALNEARVAQIATDLQNALAPYTHEQSMLSTYGGMYQKQERFGAYRSALTQNNNWYTETIGMYQQALQEEEAAMLVLEAAGQGSSQAWLNAREAAYQYEEAIASATNAIEENNEAIQESYVLELSSKYQNREDVMSHNVNMAKARADRYNKAENYAGYQDALQYESELMTEQLEMYEQKRQEIVNLMDSDNITYGGKQWQELNKQLMQLDETIETTTADSEELARQLQQSELDYILERFNENDNVRQHSLKMIQYQQTKYQNNGELTNVNTGLQLENEKQEERAQAIREQIGKLEEQREKVVDQPQAYNKITSEIMKLEEELQNTNNVIDSNNKKIEENIKQIAKLNSAVAQAVDKEIRERIQLEKDMLAGTVNVQNSILEQIRKRYQDEWALIRKDIEKKKEALNKEKNLINERLNARKEAASQEEKYAKLAELQAQLALVAADPTRNKEAKELRKQITDLQNELAMDIAEKEAEMAIQMADDQLKAYDENIEVEEERLNEFLENARNFKDEIDKILDGSFEDYVEYMKGADDKYLKATDEERKQIEEEWRQYWNKMKGYADMYWEEVDVHMATKDDFIEFMKGNKTYKDLIANGSQSALNEAKIMEQTFADMYDARMNALKDDADYNHTDEVIKAIDGIHDRPFKVEVVEGEITGDVYTSALKYQYKRPTEVTAEATAYTGYDELSKITGAVQNFYDYYKSVVESGEIYKAPIVNVSVSSGGTGGSPAPATDVGDTSGDTKGKTGIGTGALQGALGAVLKYYKIMDDRGYELNHYVVAYNEKKARAKVEALSKYWRLGPEMPAALAAIKKGKGGTPYIAYKSGGYVDYTGPAWVDGSKKRPEAFLDAYDTQSIRMMLDSFNYIRTMPFMSQIDTSGYANNNISIGDVNVNLYEAKLEKDADYDAIAQKVGQAFTKQLSRNGFNLSAYSM